MKIPVTIFTGFLGAGKTTIISNLLKRCRQRKFAVIVNEFGSASIDGSIIRQAGEPGGVEVSNVTGGLMAYSDDHRFDQVLDQIGARGSEFEHLIMETSGLAVPTAIVERLERCQKIFSLDSIIAVVDAQQLLTADERLPAIEEVFRSQLEAADLVALNKIERLAPDQLLECEARLRRVAPTIRFVELAKHGELNQKLVLGLHLHATRKMQALGIYPARSPVRSGHSLDGHEHEGWAAHEHGLHTHEHIHEHDPAWLSFSLHCHGRQDERKLVDAIEKLAQGAALYRAKGFFTTTENRRLELQCVRNQVTVMDAPEQADGISHLVFIGYNLSKEQVVAQLSTDTSCHWH